jgi:hypothetical protein
MLFRIRRLLKSFMVPKESGMLVLFHNGFRIKLSVLKSGSDSLE